MTSRYWELKALREAIEASAAGACLPDDPSLVYAYGYVRLSKAKQQKGWSAEAQEEELREFIGDKAWTCPPDGIQVEVIEGWKKVANRPKLAAIEAQIVARVRAQQPVTLSIPDVSRSGRDFPDLVQFQERMYALGVPVFYVREGGVLNRAQAREKAQQAEAENKKRAERVSKSKAHLAKKGFPTSGPAGWGYRWRLPSEAEQEDAVRAGGEAIGKNVRRVLEEHPNEAPAVRELFTRRAAGESLGRLCQWVASLSDAERGGRKLTLRRVLAILASPLYVRRAVRPVRGVMPTPTEVLALPVGQWPALVPDDVWLTVQQREAPAAQRRPGRPAGSASAVWLLSGRVVCPICGAPMYGERHEGTRRYRCSSRLRGARAGGPAGTGGGASRGCAATSNQPALDAAVVDEVCAVLQWLREADPATHAVLQQAWDTFQPPAADPDTEATRGALRATIEERGTQLKALDALAGVLDATTLADSRAKLAQERLTAQAALKALPPPVPAPHGPVPPLLTLLAQAGRDYEALQGAAADADAAPIVPIIRELVAEVTPVRLSHGHGTLPTEAALIKWTERGRHLFDLAAALRPSLPEEPFGEWTPSQHAGTGQGKLTARFSTFTRQNPNVTFTHGQPVPLVPPAAPSVAVAEALIAALLRGRDAGR